MLDPTFSLPPRRRLCFWVQEEQMLMDVIALPFLHHTELLLGPTLVYGVLWFAALFGFNIPKHIGPLLVLGAR